jgi:hypothetical protein
MTKTYIKIDLSQIEQHYYLFNMLKYHTLLMEKINKSDIIKKYDSVYSEDFIKRKYKVQLLNKLINSNQVKEMKKNYQSYLKSKR